MMPIISTNQQGFFPSIFSDFNRVFNDNWMPQHTRSSQPAINVSEDDKAYHVELAAPGMTKEDFHISLNDGDIVIAMERKQEKTDENKEKKYLRREFSYSKFEQRFILPDNIDEAAIAAQMTDGVLHISLPKKIEEEAPTQPKFIEIK